MSTPREQLQQLLAVRSQDDVALEVGVSRPMVSMWASGKKTINPAKAVQIARVLEAHRRQVAPAASIPDLAPLGPAESSKRALVGRDPVPIDLPGHRAAANLSAYRRALTNYERAEKVLLGAQCSPREMAALQSEVTKAINTLRAAEPSSVKLLGSPEWAAVVKGIEESLRPFPEAASRVHAVFRKLDDDAAGDIQRALGPDV